MAARALRKALRLLWISTGGTFLYAHILVLIVVRRVSERLKISLAFRRKVIYNLRFRGSRILTPRASQGLNTDGSGHNLIENATLLHPEAFIRHLIFTF